MKSAATTSVFPRFAQCSEGQRLNKLIREKNVEGFLPKSISAYMNAAKGLASEAEVALRNARKNTDAADRHMATVAEASDAREKNSTPRVLRVGY